MIIDVMDRDEFKLRMITDDKDPDKIHVYNPAGVYDPIMIYVSKDAVNYDINVTDMLNFMETRCIPHDQDGVDWWLRKVYKLKFYNPVAICKQTHGTRMNDFYWVKFDNEDIKFDNVRVR